MMCKETRSGSLSSVSATTKKCTGNYSLLFKQYPTPYTLHPPMFGLDRLITLYLFHPLKRILPRPNGIRIPILMYHSISDEPESSHPYFWINTSPKRFAGHMQFLHNNNYKVISLPDAVRIIKSATNHPITQSPYPPIKYVVLTFDDGYRDFYTEAFPILKEYEFNATVFLATGFISDGALWFKGKRCLPWGEIRDIAGLG